MVTAEVSAAYLLLMLVGTGVGLSPSRLTAIPPLDGLAALGVGGAFVADLLALVATFAGFVVLVLYSAAAVGWLRGDMGREHVRQSLAAGRQDAGLRLLLWVVLAAAPIILVASFVLARPPHPALLIFVVALVAGTAAQTLRPFELVELWRGARRLGSAARELARMPSEVRSAGHDQRDIPGDHVVERPTTEVTGWLGAEPRTQR